MYEKKRVRTTTETTTITTITTTTKTIIHQRNLIYSVIKTILKIKRVKVNQKILSLN